MRDRQPVDPTALAAQPISDRAHRIVGTRDHHRSRTIDRRDAHIVPQHRRYLVFTGLHRKHGAAGGQRLHQPSTRGHQHRRIRQTQRPGDARRGQLAHRMTQHQTRPHPHDMSSRYSATSTANSAGWANSVVFNRSWSCPQITSRSGYRRCRSNSSTTASRASAKTG